MIVTDKYKRQEILDMLIESGSISAKDIVEKIEKHPEILLLVENMTKEEAMKMINNEKSRAIKEALIRILNKK